MNQLLVKHRGLINGLRIFLMILAIGAMAALAVAQPNIVRVEYYIDTDPGYGNATALTITPGTNLSNQSLNIDPTPLASGVHRVGIRAKDANGVWSHDNTWLFFKPYTTSPVPPPSPVPNITQVEYYIDTDPGYGNATQVAITPGQNLSNLTLNVNPTPLTEGVHRLGIRAKDANGVWSHDNTWLFFKPYTTNPVPPAGPVPNITQVEYYIDTDPGKGNGTQIAITPGQNLSNVTFNINPTTLSYGVHQFGIRAKDANGVWSHDSRWLFVRPDPAQLVPPNPVPALAYIEYYIDTDPGKGNAVPVALNPAVNFNNLSIPINVSGLSAGNHVIGIRAKDSLGNWSHDNLDTFSVPSPFTAPQITVVSQTKRTMCAGSSFDLSYHATGTYNSGNVFTAQLSDATGSFSNPHIIGSIASSSSTIISCTLPSHLPDGSNYRVRIVSSNPAVTGMTGDTAYTIYDRPYAQTVSGDVNVNQGYSYAYSVPPVATSSFAWIVPAATIAQTNNAASLLWNIVGQPQSLQVIETNQHGCIGDTSSLMVNVYPLIIDTVVASSLIPCPASVINITATASGVYASGNVFTAQLSDANGSFANPVAIGAVTANPLGNNQPVSIQATMPFPLMNGTGYRIRVVSSNPVVTGSDNEQNIVVDKPFIGNDTTVSKCPGFTFNLSGLYTNPSLVYTWNTATPGAADIGVYTVVGTNANGCKDTAVVTVANYPKPNLGKDTTVSKCPGFTYDITTLYNTTGLTASWSIANAATADTGTYVLIVTNSNGCKDTALVTVLNYPKPNLGNDTTLTVCFGTTVDLTNVYNTSGLATSWSTATPSAATAGAYSLIVTNANGCKDTAIITVNNYPKPNLGTDKTVYKCPGFTYNLTTVFTTSGLTVNWNTATPASAEAGTYTLIVTSNDGCKDTALVTVLNHAKPNLGNDTTISVCPGFNFDLTTVYNTTGLTTSWSTATPTSVSTGTYTLTVTNANGCMDTAMVTITLYPKPALGNDTSITVCFGTTANLIGLYNTSGLTTTWSTATPSAVSAGNYSLIVSNASGCKDTAMITVNNYPKPNLGNDTTLYICPGFTADISNLYNTTGLTATWSTANPSSAGVGVYTLIVTNANNCKDTAIVTVINNLKPVIGNDTVISLCPGFTADLTALYNTSGLTATWSTATPSSVTAGIYTLVITNANGCKDTAIITVNNATKPNLGNDQSISICPGFTADLTTLFNTSGLTASWSTPNPSSVTAGLYSIIVTNAQGCRDTAVATVAQYNKPNLGSDTTVVLSCNQTTYDLTTLYTTAGLTVTWSATTPSAAPAGSYTLVVENVNGCKDTALITVGNQPLVAVPSSGQNVKTANRECTESNGWTHYYYNNSTPANLSDDILLLSIKKNGNNIGNVGDPGFSITVGATTKAGSNTADTVVNTIISDPNGVYTMNRYWNVTPVTQPTTAVNVRFYYNTADFTDVEGSAVNTIAHTNMEMYKIVGGNPDPTTNWSGATSIVAYKHAATPGLNNWTYTSLGNGMHQSEFLTTTFSGGSMGVTASGFPLPIELLSFEAVLEDSKARVAWKVSSDVSTEDYHVQVSYDGLLFENAAKVVSKHSANEVAYSYLHTPLPDKQIAWYRLLVNDVNGKGTYSKTIQLRLPHTSRNLIKLYPNPATKYVLLDMDMQAAFDGDVTIMNMQGQEIQSQKLILEKGQHKLHIDITNLASGSYLIKVRGNDVNEALRFSKE